MQEAGDARTDTGDSQVGRLPCEGDGNYGEEMGDAQVGRGPRVVVGAGTMAGVDASGWDGRAGAENKIRGSAIEAGKE